jgi:hypothetical protein
MVEFAAFDIRNQMQLPFIKINPVIIVFSASQMQHYSLCHLTLSVFPSSPQRYMLPSEHKGQTCGCDAESPPYRLYSAHKPLLILLATPFVAV